MAGADLREVLVSRVGLANGRLVLRMCGFPRQHSFFCRLTEDKKSERFFKVFYDRMKVAQQEIKATVTVNTSDLGNKKKDEETDRDAPSRKKGKCPPHPPHPPPPRSSPSASLCSSRTALLPCSSLTASRLQAVGGLGFPKQKADPAMTRFLPRNPSRIPALGRLFLCNKPTDVLLGQAPGVIGGKSINNPFL